MGSFNAACSISNISISAGDLVAYIPLENAKYRYHIGDGNDMLLHTNCFYVPVTLPVFGIYDDYGGVDDIEENKNTKIIEEHFGMPIAKVIDRKRNGEVGTISSGMFIHRKIYDAIVNKCSRVGEWGNITSPVFGPHKDDPIKSLTAKLEEYIKEVEKANKSYKSLMEGLFLGDKERKPFWKTVHNITKSPIKHVKDAMVLRKLDASLKKMREGHSDSSPVSINNIFAFREYGVFNDIYQSKIQQGELRGEIIEFVLFECGIGAINNFYFPAMNGYQCGNHWASKILYWEAFKIMVSKTLRQKYDWLKPKNLKWSIKYGVKRRWKRIKKYVSPTK